MKKTLFWLPRLLTIIFILFISIFALDVFGEYKFPELLVALFMHLVPTFILIGVLIIAWKWELPGGLIFIGLAIFAGFFFNIDGYWERLLIIPLPIFLIGILFLLDYKYNNKKSKS